MEQTMHELWTNRLSAYLDGELSEADRTAADAHLAACEECRQTLADLGQVKARAAALPDTGPAHDLWHGIEARIAAGSASMEGTASVEGAGPAARPMGIQPMGIHRRRFSFTAPQLAAAAVALMLLSGGTTWLSRGGSGGAADRAAAPAALPARSSHLAGAAAAARIGTPYATAIRDLERRLDYGRSRLNPLTVRVLEESLASVDRAIESARRALSVDPHNPYLSRHLANEMEQKLELLRRADALASSQL